MASYYAPDDTRPFAFCRSGLLVDPDGQARFVLFSDIEDGGYHDGEQLMAAKAARRAGETLVETLSVQLASGERIDLPLNPRSDGLSERLTIAALVDRYARIHRPKT